MNYEKYASKAKSKISKYGGDCVIVRKSEETYNPETNEYEAEEERIEGKCLVSSYDASNIDGTNIKSGDIKVMAVLGSAPKTGESIEISGKTYTVISWSELNPDGAKNIYYTIQAR